MGSGKRASADYRHAAYLEFIRSLPYLGAWTVFQDSLGTLNTPFVTDSACYDMSTPFLTAGDNWFFFGGSGKGSTGCNY